MISLWCGVFRFHPIPAKPSYVNLGNIVVGPETIAVTLNGDRIILASDAMQIAA
jgi:hypothetical protein